MQYYLDKHQDFDSPGTNIAKKKRKGWMECGKMWQDVVSMEENRKNPKIPNRDALKLGSP